MSKIQKKRQKVWIKAFNSYLKSDMPLKSKSDAEMWADYALKAFDKAFKDEKTKKKKKT